MIFLDFILALGVMFLIFSGYRAGKKSGYKKAIKELNLNKEESKNGL